MAKAKSLVPIERIEWSILVIRGQKVLMDTELARLYGTTTKRLNEQVRRNIERFPEDFMFQMTDDEFLELKEQAAAANGQEGWGGRRYPPYVFTEHGAIMAAGLINTPIAIEVSIFVVRAFIRLRKIYEKHEDLARKLDALEKKYDAQFSAVFDAIRQLMAPPKPRKNQIGFQWKEKPAAPGKKKPAKKKPAKVRSAKRTCCRTAAGKLDDPHESRRPGASGCLP